MNKKTKTWIVAGATVVAIGFAGINVLAYNHARAMMRFTTGGDRTRKPEARMARNMPFGDFTGRGVRECYFL
jgi:hypothetical protein